MLLYAPKDARFLKKTLLFHYFFFHMAWWSFYFKGKSCVYIVPEQLASWRLAAACLELIACRAKISRLVSCLLSLHFFEHQLILVSRGWGNRRSCPLSVSLGVLQAVNQILAQNKCCRSSQLCRVLVCEFSHSFTNFPEGQRSSLGAYFKPGEIWSRELPEHR